MDYVYILECKDGTFYTGYTNDLEKRIKTHNSGRGAKYTRCRLPVRIVYSEAYESRSEAMKREYFIKQLSRQAKIKLMSNVSVSLPK
ncbi:GIY-YIG nuclease family protein [Clostridium fermenticellae]|uniref:GIY-YIG nuclease family protein n=1 Tax=Clostridium fermenticellae TaxID=2068654 RepID=A0A386H6H8_9CLOT|nr:GIY-YIG nuclease family protein [Clostridium fermenticellae]AYD41230.1 GIY-YIG nuclease family protein [Clostridium fermenticellae]